MIKTFVIRISVKLPFFRILIPFVGLGQALDMIWDMTRSIAHDLWQSAVSCSRLLSTTRKRLPAGRGASFRSGICYSKSPRLVDNEIGRGNKWWFYFQARKGGKRKCRRDVLFTNVCNHVFSVRRIVMYLADTYRSPARRWRNGAHANIYCCFWKEERTTASKTSNISWEIQGLENNTTLVPWGRGKWSLAIRVFFLLPWAELINLPFVNSWLN